MATHLGDPEPVHYVYDVHGRGQTMSATQGARTDSRQGRPASALTASRPRPTSPRRARAQTARGGEGAPAGTRRAAPLLLEPAKVRPEASVVRNGEKTGGARSRQDAPGPVLA